MAMNDEASTTNVNFPQGMNPWGMFNSGRGMAGSGLGLGIAGTVLGGLALLGARIGNLGLGGGMAGACNEFATQRDLDYERKLTEANAVNAKLEAQIYTDAKVDALRQELQTVTTTQAVLNTQQSGVIAVLQNQVAQFQAMQMNVLRPAVINASEAVSTAFKGGTATPANAGGGSGSGQ